MMHLTLTIFLIWVVSLIGQVILLSVLFLRHRATMFPFFTAYTAVCIVNSLVLYAVALYSTKHTYLVVYVIFGFIDFAQQLTVAYELGSHVFCPTGSWAPDVRKSFLMLIVASLAIATFLTCLPEPPSGTSALGILLDRCNIFSSALICPLFVGMIALSATANLPWKTHVARIAQGLGFYSLFGLITEAWHCMVIWNSIAYQYLTYARQMLYLLCLFYWIVMLWREAPAPQELPEETRRQLFTLQRRVEYDLRKLRALKR
jgi:hypothetical protein